MKERERERERETCERVLSTENGREAEERKKRREGFFSLEAQGAVMSRDVSRRVCSSPRHFLSSSGGRADEEGVERKELLGGHQGGHNRSHSYSLEIERAFKGAWDVLPGGGNQMNNRSEYPKYSGRDYTYEDGGQGGGNGSGEEQEDERRKLEHIRRCGKPKSYQGFLRARRLLFHGTVLLVLAPVITYLLCLVIFGIICACQRSGLAPKLPCSIYDQWKTLRRHGITDFQIDIGLTDQLSTFARERNYRNGKKKVRKNKILVLGLVNNAEESLETLTRDLDELKEHLPDSDFVACESCSTDRSREILLDWEARHLDDDEGSVSVPDPLEWSPSSRKCGRRKDNDPKHGIYGVRETRLAQLRNECLMNALVRNAGSSYDYLITLDMDIYRIDYKGILDSFGSIAWMEKSRQKWSVLCANGKFVNGIYRDTYAHRASLVDTSEHYKVEDKETHRSLWIRDKFLNLKGREKVQSKIKDIVRDKYKRKKLYEVDSCFGGLAIYDMERIMKKDRDVPKCTYWGLSKIHRKRHLKPDCEHVSFNACVIGKYEISYNNETSHYKLKYNKDCKHCHPALLNPRMQVWHGKGAWTGMMGPGLFYPILVLGLWMSLMDLPLFLFSQDSLFLVSWIVVYLVTGSALYAVYQCYCKIKCRSFDWTLRALLQGHKAEI